MDTVRESPVGQLLRWITGNRLLLYPEEMPGFIFSMNKEKMERRLELEQNFDIGFTTTQANHSSEDLSYSPPRTDLDASHAQDATTKCIVDWYGPDDPSNPRNWSPLKKKAVALQIWCDLKPAFISSIVGGFLTHASDIHSLYTFVVYCGSAIYVPAER